MPDAPIVGGVNPSSPRPLVGLTIGGVAAPEGRPRLGVNRVYVEALQAAGADVVLLPPAPRGDAPVAAALLDRLDGLLLPGGGDVDPALYGERPRPVVVGVDGDRDALELPLVRLAIERRLPLLGICRGHQVVNVALGGSLYQDVLADGLTDVPHATDAARGRTHVAHLVEVRPGTRLHAIAGDRVEVNSFHHQAVRRVAPGLRVTAVSAADGVVEGLESPDGLVLTVQCHPEELTVTHEWARQLFRSFVASAAGRAPIAQGG